jgi:hypothetical protein
MHVDGGSDSEAGQLRVEMRVLCGFATRTSKCGRERGQRKEERLV